MTNKESPSIRRTHAFERTDALPRPRSGIARYSLGIAFVGGATVLRLALDPLVHEQVAYLAYVASLVLATWFCGKGAGFVSMIVAAFTANYFFVEPRHEMLPHAQDWVAMAVFSAIGLGMIWLVGRWRNAENVLRQQVDELHTIFETVPAAIFVTRDPKASRMDGNKLAAEYLRLPPGANLSKTAPPGERPLAFRLMKDDRELQGDDLPVQMAIARGVEVRDYEFDVVYEDGTRRPLFGNVAPLRDRRGRIRGSVGAFIDVAELRRLESELREANRIKDDFFATLSHELRTPLSAIVGWSDMLRREKLGRDAARRAAESIYRNAQAQSQIVNDLLDVSRITSGQTRIEMQPLDPVTVLKNALDSVRPSAEGKGLKIVTLLQEVPVPVYGDASRLQQVFWNLLTNAIKFTPAGGEIRVLLTYLNEQLQVQVADTGIGMSADFLPHAFERFRQRDSSSTRHYGGLGLGLAIVRHLVELHGGTATAESRGEGQGATFTVTLPATPAPERRHEESAAVRHVEAVTPSAEDLPTLCGMRVLVVDDASEARELAASVLRHYGAVVSDASSASEAMREFKTFAPNVVLLDLAMPEVDGFALIRQIRAVVDGGRDVPAVALTAYAREEDRRRALAAGFDLHLAKPIDAHALVRAVHEVVRQKQSHQG